MNTFGQLEPNKVNSTLLQQVFTCSKPTTETTEKREQEWRLRHHAGSRFAVSSFHGYIETKFFGVFIVDSEQSKYQLGLYN